MENSLGIWKVFPSASLKDVTREGSLLVESAGNRHFLCSTFVGVPEESGSISFSRPVTVSGAVATVHALVGFTAYADLRCHCGNYVYIVEIPDSG